VGSAGLAVACEASWEIYGDWIADPARLETTVKYLLVAPV